MPYTKEKSSLSLAETVYENQSSDAALMDEDEDIKINGIEGKYVSLEKDEILKIAESISEKA